MTGAVGSQERYKPPPEFIEDRRDPLVGISLTDSTELWLLQWQPNQLQPDDFQGKELTLKLHRDGKLGSFESSSGKSYEFVSFSAQEPDANVIIASASESKVVGKISRRVSLVRYPEPSELEKPKSSNHTSLSSQLSAGSSKRSSYHSMTPSKSSKTKSSHVVNEMSHHRATPSSSKQRDSGIFSGTSFESGDLGKRSKQRQFGRQSSSRDQSTRDSGRSSLSSLVTHSEHSDGTKLKKIKVEE